jgi:hypothetical protein
VSRWQPPHPDLRRIRIDVEGKLLAAQLRGEIPGQRGYSPRPDDVRYEVLVSRDIRTGVVSVGVRIERFEHLASRPDDPLSVLRWTMTAGLTLVRLVDQIIGRPELRGRTLLIAELDDAETDQNSTAPARVGLRATDRAR